MCLAFITSKWLRTAYREFYIAGYRQALTADQRKRPDLLTMKLCSQIFATVQGFLEMDLMSAQKLYWRLRFWIISYKDSQGTLLKTLEAHKLRIGHSCTACKLRPRKKKREWIYCLTKIKSSIYSRASFIAPILKCCCLCKGNTKDSFPLLFVNCCLVQMAFIIYEQVISFEKTKNIFFLSCGKAWKWFHLQGRIKPKRLSIQNLKKR